MTNINQIFIYEKEDFFVSIMLIAIANVCIMTSCGKEDLLQTETNNPIGANIKSSQDNGTMNTVIQRYSKVVAVTLKDSEFRRLVQTLSVKQCDGDYDVNDFGYQIYRQTNGTNPQLIATTPINTNNYIDNTVVAEQRYTYTVRALNSQSQPSGFSPSVSWHASERFPGETLKLGSLKFDNKSSLCNFESWVKGKPELVLHVYSGTSVDASKEIRRIDWITPQPKRSKIAGCW